MRKPGKSTRLLAGAIIALLLLSQLSLAAAETYTGTVNADKVLMRPQPNTASSDYINKLSKGTKVVLLDIAGDFFKIRFDGRTGFMMKKFVTVSAATLGKLKDTVAPISTSVYAKAGSIAALGDPPKTLKYGAHGTDVEKLQRALQLKDVYEGTVDGGFGQKTLQALKAYQKKKGLPVTGVADYATISKLFGRVAETTVAQDPGMDGIKSISQITVPNTSQRGDSGKHVKALQQALKIKGYFKAAIDATYGDKTVAAVKAYQKQYGLKADGVAGNGTIRKLFGKNAANFTIKTERLDWFNGGSGLIPKGAIFTIKDVASGSTFSAKRWSGVNHLDAEPLTGKDSDAMKAIFGGWSWARRAILVKYNDHVYAASMNGMPHDDDTLLSNDFAGHFCIHFYKSRTHGTNRVDETHQNAVARAMNATW
ncbi:MAG: peptidoglycan-binding protein [Christensenellales bacterium]